MLWNFLYRVLGWDYIHWSNHCSQGVARVYVDGNGKPYYWRYKNIKAAYYIEGAYDSIMWLTCPPSKYLPSYK